MRYVLASVVAIAATSSTAVGPVAEAEVVICQGQAATIVGPTDGQDTTGTEGDDVIVAPLDPSGRVQGLGGNDTICLVDGAGGASRDPAAVVYAGAGDDSVTNETTHLQKVRIELGGGADHFVGANYSENVYGAWAWFANGADTEIDVLETRGGDDYIDSGSAGVANHDTISTGTGSDGITYIGAAGGTLDNGADADWLSLQGSWSGELSIDNVQRKATVGSVAVLTWTAVHTFSVRAVPGSHVAFTGSDADETLNIAGSVNDLEAPASIVTGGGDDIVRVESYLPARVETGAGYDIFTYVACHRAFVALGVSAECLTKDGRELSTSIAAIEYFFGRTLDGLTVVGTDRAERVGAFARYVLVRGKGGADRVHAGGSRTTQVVGGRGDDKLAAPGKGVTVFGGRGSDVLRGGIHRDVLRGGPGQDTAYGKKGRDRCVAEVRVSCELR